MPMKSLFAIIVLLVMYAAIAGRATGATCYEDEPCFRWSTMGNHQRGWVAVKGDRHRHVVNTCQFAALNFNHMIDWKRTPHLHGDRWAIKHGCDPEMVR